MAAHSQVKLQADTEEQVMAGGGITNLNCYGDGQMDWRTHR